ncbi:T9SS type A sorting domain-containing protein [Aggregatimonas sangjinii]|uniref:T9SS type A sorting domain-containing protein n=1 Tax=Aggregatimonas sangjinii TaxID=2583587 RepID=A0A5B7SW27_9FLAO|nr:zinc-dependent metalloprotease family protein [Aggregatimonas sangjinii]QCX01383.1 T9SS type A sorting domain-containing protein [Aggregatimonas sangjinii]
MIAKLRLVFTITIVFASFWGYSQDNYWHQVQRADHPSKNFLQQIDVEHAKVFAVDEGKLKSSLKNLSAVSRNRTKIYFPDETGKNLAFFVYESPVLAPELAAKYPNIKSYRGRGIDDVNSEIRFSVSHKGFQVMMVHPEKTGHTYIQKTSQNDYVAYSRQGLSKKDNDFVCETKSSVSKNVAGTTARPVDDRVLRKYRLAVSATGEYTNFHGGTIADALAAINATVTRMNQIFETDLAVTLEVIANNDQVIFTNAADDPYSDNLNVEVQSTLTDIIGEANYDIGHLFHQAGNGGDAGFIGRICVDGQKGSAYSSAVTPSGDTFDIDFVAHEIGHQLGANHSWSFESEGTGVQVEPGSGTTIMGYAGITQENDVALRSDAYFHYVSIVQIIENLKTKSCGELLVLSNNPPVIESIPDYVIPTFTAFQLEGSAADPDTGDVLTYAWEQIDDGVVVQGSFGPASLVGANFRSREPSTDPGRYFPLLERVLDGNLTQTVPSVNSAWETVSSIQKDMNFALTVRDNAVGGGQVVSELVNVSVVDTGSAFSVSSQPSGTSYVAGEIHEVTWVVANTNEAPVNTPLVDIFLSVDGGLTFPILLAEATVNDGSHNIQLPGTATTNARIMVRGNGNIFFAVNEADFTIAESQIVLNTPQTIYEVCQPNAAVVPFVYETYSGFSEEVMFEVSGLPAGVTAVFSPASASASDTPVTLTINDTANADDGDYAITVRAVGASQTKELPLQLLVSGNVFPEVDILSPLNAAVDVSKWQLFEWEDNALYTSYDIQIATDSGFANVIEAATVFDTTFKASNLDNGATYFWRLRPRNGCGEGSFGSGLSFTTIEENCANRSGIGLPIAITDEGTPTISSKLIFYDDLRLTDLKVNLELDHTYLSDLVITLTSPSGKEAVLVSNSCGNLRNINATFDDDANDFVCGGNPGIAGTVAPLIGFDNFNGESIAGEWVLTVRDTENIDGGSLIGFSMDVCVEGEFAPDEDSDGVFDANDLCAGTPLGTEVDLTGCPIYRFANDNFTIQATSKSCRTENDGNITIESAQSLDHTVVITGNGVNISEGFTTSYNRSDLDAGLYNVCITAFDDGREYEEVCFEVTISEPEALSVTSRQSLNENSVVLSLSGSETYTIELNGVLSQTSEDEVTVDLEKGNNVLKVTGALSCQGSYEERFFIASGILFYPNPTTTSLNIYIEGGGEVDIALYAIDGKLVLSQRKNLQQAEMELDVSDLSAGTYFLKVDGKMQKGSYKIIKQ